MVNILDTVYVPDGGTFTGSIAIQISATVTYAGDVYEPQEITATVVAGALDVDLVPNEGSVPSGTTYQAIYTSTTRQRWVETWVVPASAIPVALADVLVATIGQSGITLAAVVTIADGADVAQGAIADAKVDTDATGTVNAHMRGMVSRLASLDAKTPALGQALAVASVPVVLTAAQLATLTPTGSASAYHLVSSASTNATVVKASAGQVYQVSASNTNFTARYLKIFDKATTPNVGTDTPVWTCLIPGNTAGAVTNVSIPTGLDFASGRGIALTRGPTDANADAVAAEEIIVNLGYK